MNPLDLEALKAKAKAATPDCGDNSCRFAKRPRPPAMRTNGGCRCVETRDPAFRMFIAAASPDVVLSLIERIETMRKALEQIANYSDPEFGWVNLAREALKAGE